MSRYTEQTYLGIEPDIANIQSNRSLLAVSTVVRSARAAGSEQTLFTVSNALPAAHQAIKNIAEADYIALTLAFVFVVAALTRKCPEPKNSRVCFVVILSIWFWTTIEWADGCKLVVYRLGLQGMPPSVTLWLTIIPQVVTSLCVMPVAWVSGVDITRDVVPVKSLVGRSRGSPEHDGERINDERVTWFVGGLCFLFGQLFTVAALIAAAPSLVFAVKAMEPLTTALLAIPTLGHKFSVTLFFAMLISCVGVVIVAMPHEAEAKSAVTHPGMSNQFTVCGVVFLANLGYSARACIIKKMFATNSNHHALESFGKITLTATSASAIPAFFVILTWCFQGYAGVVLGAGKIMDELTDNARMWITLSICCFLYQGCSILILECIAVESHALMCTLKHLGTAIGTTLLLGQQLSSWMVLGLAMTFAGIYIYQKVPPEYLDAYVLTGGHSGGEKQPTTVKAPPKAAPKVLHVISVVLTIGGTYGVLSGRL